ncbi:MAG: Wzy polymerase domain-containing protein [Polaromonas sp.]|nr:Wzy polymerase domain-containing protein [Polaromonas sp.]
MPSVFVFLLIALPWLNPFASAPTPAVVPLLFSWACAALLLGVWGCGRGRPNALPWVSVTACAWLAAGLASSLIGLCQYFGMADHFSPWINQTVIGEAFANLRQRNQFATLTSISLAALLWVVVNPGRLAARQHGLMLLVAGVLAVGNAASSSRTGLLQLGLLLLLFGVWGGLRHAAARTVLLVVVGAYGSATLALPWLAGLDLSAHGMVARLQPGDQSCGSRLTLWANVLQLIGQKPWSGWGWGELDHAHFMTLYEGPRFCDILDNAHNLPLHLAVEFGVPLALAFCCGVVWWVVRQQPWRESDATRRLAWAVLAVIGLHSLLEYPMWYGPFQMAVGWCVIVLWRIKQAAGTRDKAHEARICKYTAPLTMVLMTALAYAAWDYHRVSQIYRAPETRDPDYREGTLDKIRSSWLFAEQVRFAELSLTPLRPANAQWTFDTALALLHYSPEARVVEKVIESAVMLGRDDDALLYLVRYRAAFPAEYTQWRHTNGLTDAPAQ